MKNRTPILHAIARARRDFGFDLTVHKHLLDRRKADFLSIPTKRVFITVKHLTFTKNMRVGLLLKHRAVMSLIQKRFGSAGANKMWKMSITGAMRT